jgi:hypothetical protein
MIIGVSGKSQSGKDLVGKIIQYLTSGANERYSFNKYQEIYPQLGTFGIGYDPDWKIKKFANKLKDIVCILIGCTREQLEDQKFKETPLGEEWRIWKVFYINKYNESDISYFLSKKEYDEFVNRTSLLNSCHITNIDNSILTPRKLLQNIGTDLFRNRLHPNIWVNALMNEYKAKTISSFDLSKLPNEETINSYGINRIKNEGEIIYKEANWIITDVRFPNEAQAIKDKGGILIRVNRIDANEMRDNKIIGFKESDGSITPYNHPSETALDNYEEFDYIINNNGTIDELIEQVRAILIQNKLINLENN